MNFLAIKLLRIPVDPLFDKRNFVKLDLENHILFGFKCGVIFVVFMTQMYLKRKRGKSDCLLNRLALGLLPHVLQWYCWYNLPTLVSLHLKTISFSKTWPF